MCLHTSASLLRDVLEDSIFFESHLFECLGQENLVQLPFCLETLYYIPSQSCGGALAVPGTAWWPRGAPEPARGQELQDMERFPGGVREWHRQDSHLQAGALSRCWLSPTPAKECRGAPKSSPLFWEQRSLPQEQCSEL